MAKQIWKPGNMLYPLPAVMVSTADKSGKSNIITVAWTGTVCTNPAMLYISVRPERYSYDLLKDSGEFVVNLTTEKLKKATDWCGVRSGLLVLDKWKEMHLTAGRASKLDLCTDHRRMSGANIECKVTEIQKELGSHHMFLAKAEAVQVGEEYLDEKGRLQLGKAGLLAYSHGEYLTLGKTHSEHLDGASEKLSASRKNKKTAEKKPVQKEHEEYRKESGTGKT